MKQLTKTIILSLLALQVIRFHALAAVAPPKNVHSFAGQGFISVTWDPVPDPTVRGYRLYKRAPTSDYSSASSFFVSGARFKDIPTGDGETCFYVVKAVDEAGNEGDPSVETAITSFDLKQRAFNDLVNKKAGPFSAHIAAVGDLNGDGNPDLVLGTDNGVKIVLGCDRQSTPRFTLTGEGHDDGFGKSLAIADLNRDGYDDLIVGAPRSQGGASSKGRSEGGRVFVYAGGPSFSVRPTLILSGESSRNENLGASMASVGDVNGDGYPDVAIGAPGGGEKRRGRVLFLLGGRPVANRTFEIAGPDGGSHFGSSVAAAGDIDRDGWRDVLVGACDPSERGRVQVIRGGAPPELSAAFWAGGPHFGAHLAGLDFNGDGFSDVVVGASDREPTRVYFGGSSLVSTPDMVLPQGKGFVGSLGDVSGDGLEDLVLAAVSVQLGNKVGDNLPDVVWKSGCGVIGAGDIDGDGTREVIAQCGSATHRQIVAYSLVRPLGLPVITLHDPHDLTTVETRSLPLRGAVTGEVTRLVVRGRPLQVGSDGSFEGSVPLEPGLNVLELLAETADHRIAKRTLHVTCDAPSSLSIELISPQDGAEVHSRSITVAGTVSDPSAAVDVNGVAATLSGTRFEAAIELIPGDNGITATASTSNGETATARVTVHFIRQAPSVRLSADPDRILPGRSSVLSWFSTEADSAAFDQGIGAVETSGTVTVSPTVTTPYTITATGPGGSASATVTVGVDQPAPVATLAADPETISAGEASTLSWTSAYATAWSLEPGIGAVEGSGSLRVSPGRSTVYTLTASGPGGSTAVNATVTVANRPPVANDDTASTHAGTALTLHVLQNDSDPEGDTLSVAGVTQGDHGTVTLNADSSLTYTPLPGYAGTDGFTYTATDSRGGFTSATVRVTVVPSSSIVIQITSPLPEETLYGGNTMVQGIVTNPAGIETGVTVNGLAAQIHGNTFVVNGVPLANGENILEATATDIQGGSSSATVTINADISAATVRIGATVFSGAPPLDTTLVVSSTGNLSAPSLAYTGPGAVNFQAGSNPDETRVTLTVEGIYQFTARATDSIGNLHSSSVSVVVLNRDAVDARLKSRWSTVKSALGRGSTEEALGCFIDRSRGKYRRVFNALLDELPRAISEMQEIEMIYCRNNTAKYAIGRNQLIDGQVVPLSYVLYFVMDEKGIWKVQQF